jgi:membrane protease YdiL (CAAX protease family)
MKPTIGTDKRTPSLPLQICAASIPYVAVGVGLYIFSSAWLAIAIYYAGALTYITATRRTDTLKSLTKGLPPKLLILIIPLFAIAGLIAYYLLPLAIRPDTNLTDYLASVQLAQWRFPLFAIVFCIFNPALEEALWRGTFQTNPNKPAWPDLAFAAYHIPVVIMVVNIPLTALSFALLTLTAWSLRILKQKTKSLATPYTAHLTADITILTAVYLLTQT